MQHDELLDDFLEESRDLIEKVKRALMHWPETEDKEEAINSIYRWVHTIKGGCGIFEYKDTTAVAHELETFLGKLKNDVSKVSEADLEKVYAEIHKIENSLNGEGIQVGPEVVMNSTTGLRSRHFQNWMEASELIVTDLLADGFSFFELLLPRDLGEKILDKLKEHGYVCLHTQVADSKLAALLSVNVKGTPLAAEQIRILLQKFDGFECISASSDAGTVIRSPGGDKHAPVTHEEVLRVPLGTVNSILDHIWELFLVRNQMAHLFETNKHLFKDHHGFIQQFESLDNVIERNIHAMESKTMSLRLSPITKVFDRMEKVVKDYCQQKGKQIQLVTKGEGIDLDKKVLDQLNEPLIHLIRNAIDHGIENSEERTLAGKSHEGQVVLSATVQGNEVSIIVADDGKGISADKILESARKKGLDVAGLRTENEILDLIFEPGFSTAETITDVSGRGVGMDAVRSSIKELGGSVSLETEVGKGTRFKISLPLSMSVSKCLIVSISGLEYAIPTKSVTFVERVNVHSLKHNGKDRFYEFDGELIPCYQLGELFPDYRKEPDLPVTWTHVCVTNLGGHTVAFRVDDIHQTLNVVLKSLPQGIERHSYLSGVSILPGGGPIFVLNVQECLAGMIKNKKDVNHVRVA